MRVVLDTNVIVSGVLRPASVPARVLDMIYETRVRPVVDERVLAEYAEVLVRPKLAIPGDVVAALLRRFSEMAEHVTVTDDVVARLYRFAVPDPDDRPLMEVAMSAMVGAIVTGNTAHFPAAALAPVRVLTPRQLLDELEDKQLR